MNKFVFDHRDLWHWVVTFGGVGLMRPAPGTWGSLAALPFGILALMSGQAWALPTLVFMVILLGWIGCDKIQPADDPQEVVIDEVAGMLLALSATNLQAFDIVAAFFIFRALDIFKPLLIGKIDQNYTGGLGIMGDDLLAGFVTALLILGMHYAGIG